MTATIVPAGRPFSADLKRSWIRDLKQLCPSAREAMLRGLAMSYGQRAAYLVRKGLR
jgi:hypothetical protein